MYEPLRRPLRRRARSLGREPQSGRPTASVASRSTTCVVRRLTRPDCTPPRARHRARAALSLPPSLPPSLPLSHTRLSERRAAQRSTPLRTAPCARPAPRAERLRRAERPLSSACLPCGGDFLLRLCYGSAGALILRNFIILHPDSVCYQSVTTNWQKTIVYTYTIPMTFKSVRWPFFMRKQGSRA